MPRSHPPATYDLPPRLHRRCVAAKHGIAGLTKTGGAEARRSKVACNCISPGYVWAPLVEKQIPNTMKPRGMSRDQVINDVLLAAQPAKEFVTVQQVASLALFLCSAAAAQISGANLGQSPSKFCMPNDRWSLPRRRERRRKRSVSKGEAGCIRRFANLKMESRQSTETSASDRSAHVRVISFTALHQ